MARPKRNLRRSSLKDACLRYMLASLERSTLSPLERDAIREQLQKPTSKPTNK
jgi:hypothetical protein